MAQKKKSLSLRVHYLSLFRTGRNNYTRFMLSHLYFMNFDTAVREMSAVCVILFRNS